MPLGKYGVAKSTGKNIESRDLLYNVIAIQIKRSLMLGLWNHYGTTYIHIWAKLMPELYQSHSGQPYATKVDR